MMFLMASAAWASTWFLQEELYFEVRPPVIGWQKGHQSIRWLVEWEPGAGPLTATLCTLGIDPVMGAQTSWPANTLAALPALSRPATLADGQFSMGPVSESLGDQDSDHDGNPGITIEVTHPRMGTGQVYVRQTNHLMWSGRLGADGVVRGTVDYTPDQEMFGATTWWLRMGLSQRKHPSAPSTFTLSPLPPGSTCLTPAS